mgnify:CR=1 FL=1
MAIFAVIEQNKVVNTCVADENDIKPDNWILLNHPNAGVGWDYVNGSFIDNRPQPLSAFSEQPTKEYLLTQLTVLQQQISNLAE